MAMAFEIKNKVALVTGGASGIGLALVKELLRQGVKGVTIADVNLNNGKDALKELTTEFGQDRVLFSLTDISNSTSFENAFKVTIDKFKNIDILFNNGGILMDSAWEKEVDINLRGTVNGMILGLEKYLKEYKQGNEGIIVNSSSFAAFTDMPVTPIYTATKEALLALTRCWGSDFHYERTGVRVLSICLGVTDTRMLKMLLQLPEQTVLKLEYLKFFEGLIEGFESTPQSPDFVSKESMKLIQRAPNGSIWVIEESKPAYEFILPNKNDFENNTLKCT